MLWWSLMLLMFFFYNFNFDFGTMDLILKLSFKLIIFICKISIRLKRNFFVFILYVLFLLLSVTNLLGMFPYSLTINSHLILTLFLSLSFFVGNTFIGICLHKAAFFSMFLPNGVPKLLIPFLIFIEYVSYSSRIFSLAIRLFANMMSGHILLKILISFIWTLISSHPVNWVWTIFPLIIVFFVALLEIFIAFLQAYVFIVLLAIYLKDLIHIH